jgi:hypothetical protein
MGKGRAWARKRAGQGQGRGKVGDSKQNILHRTDRQTWLFGSLDTVVRRILRGSATTVLAVQRRPHNSHEVVLFHLQGRVRYIYIARDSSHILYYVFFFNIMDQTIKQ